MSSLARSDAILAWVVTGPLGHAWSALTDMALIAGRYLAHRARRRA
jgi:Ribonuclease G/E